MAVNAKLVHTDVQKVDSPKTRNGAFYLLALNRSARQRLNAEGINVSVYVMV